MKDRLATAGLLVILVMWLGYSFYATVLKAPAVDTGLQSQVIQACERAKARSQVFQEFAHTAAEARRASAARLEAEGKAVAAAGDLAAAAKYDSFADRYDRLTTQDCTAAYATP